MTPLARKLAAEIRANGPVGVDRLVELALDDPEHGYYRTRDPIGLDGDFITSPEISQTFGEIIGAVLAYQWQVMGSPAPVHLVELGPGRGTLAADILRAFRPVPGLLAAVRLHLVETSPVLRARQKATLERQQPHWHDTLQTVPEGPLLLVANEFFDALAVRQFSYTGADWHERRVATDAAGNLRFVSGEPVQRPIGAPVNPAEGDIFEVGEAAGAIAHEIGGRLARAPGTALIIDYGHAASGFGDTLQAVRRHRYAPILEGLGESDLTTHVDFAALGAAIREGGANAWPTVTQSAFLRANGILLREASLVKNKDPETAAQVRSGIRRLIDETGMGQLFKVLAATSPGVSCPPSIEATA